MVKKSAIFVFLSLIVFGTIASAQWAPEKYRNTDAIKKSVLGVIDRQLPGRASGFTVEVISADNGKDVFEIESVESKVVLRGNSVSAICAGLNWYLKYYVKAHISWDGDRLNLPEALPATPQKVRIVSPYKQRYIYNYCTFNYTMSFWKWKDWERELDFLALNGINFALASVVGQEALWQNFMRRLGFTEKEIFDFIPGPAYEAWWLMDNLEGFGGPVTQEWIDARKDLQLKILARMSELGIEPLMQGFFGMMPRASLTRFPDAGIIETGIWGSGFKRPPMAVPSNKKFFDFAKLWYEEQKKLYGDARYFGGDPFHEGDFVKGVNLTDVALGIQKAMQDSKPDSIWVLQGWGNNPSPQLLAGTEKERTLVIDLFAESDPKWGETDGFGGTPWIWAIISNFGGKTSVHGAMGRVASEPIEALKKYPHNLQGIGAIMEGSGTNTPLWDLLFEMAWRDTKPDLDLWFDNYVERRYGKTTPELLKAWRLLEYSVYQGNGGRSSDSRPLFCSKPSLYSDITVAGYGYGPYNACKLRQAWKIMIDEADNFSDVETFRHDLVDITREYLANAIIQVHKKMATSFKKKNKEGFEKYSKMFLDMLLDLDTLQATDKYYLLGKWISDARAWGKTDSEKDLFEWNARTLLTTWGGREASAGLDDYASKEWAGMLRTYYYMRWMTFFNDLRAQIEGAKPAKIDWYGIEEPWNRDKEVFQATPAGDSIAEAKRIHEKYGTILASSCGRKD